MIAYTKKLTDELVSGIRISEMTCSFNAQYYANIRAHQDSLSHVSGLLSHRILRSSLFYINTEVECRECASAMHDACE